MKFIPITTKDDLLKHYDEWKATGYDLSRCYAAHTRRTTGAGLQFMTTPESVHAQWSGLWRARQELGISFDDWRGSFGYKLIVLRSQTKPPVWRISCPDKMIYFIVYHEKGENLRFYYECNKTKQ